MTAVAYVTESSRQIGYIYLRREIDLALLNVSLTLKATQTLSPSQ
jgi:hypothetical protein